MERDKVSTYIAAIGHIEAAHHVLAKKKEAHLTALKRLSPEELRRVGVQVSEESKKIVDNLFSQPPNEIFGEVHVLPQRQDSPGITQSYRILTFSEGQVQIRHSKQEGLPNTPHAGVVVETYTIYAGQGDLSDVWVGNDETTAYHRVNCIGQVEVGYEDTFTTPEDVVLAEDTLETLQAIAEMAGINGR